MLLWITVILNPCSDSRYQCFFLPPCWTVLFYFGLVVALIHFMIYILMARLLHFFRYIQVRSFARDEFLDFPVLPNFFCFFFNSFFLFGLHKKRSNLTNLLSNPQPLSIYMYQSLTYSVQSCVPCQFFFSKARLAKASPACDRCCQDPANLIQMFWLCP